MATNTSCFVYKPGSLALELSDLTSISDCIASPQTVVWLDVVAPTTDDFVIIKDEFHLHPLAIEDAIKMDQRPKLEPYDDVWFLVVNAAVYRSTELLAPGVAVFIGPNFLVTVRRDETFTFTEIHRRLDLFASNKTFDVGILFFTVLDVLIDTYAPTAEALQEQVDQLDAMLIGNGDTTNEVLIRSFQLKKNLSQFRRIVAPMQNVLQPIVRGELQSIHDEALPYFRDIHDHIIRAMMQIEGAREQITNARETHIALVSHQQNEVSKQLTLMATIFLPLTFITGFFGQNFAFLVNGIVSKQSFWELGVGSEIVATIALLAYFRYRNLK